MRTPVMPQPTPPSYGTLRSCIPCKVVHGHRARRVAGSEEERALDRRDGGDAISELAADALSHERAVAHAGGIHTGE